MNDKQEFFEVPKKGADRRAAKRRGGGSFVTHFIWMVFLGMAVLALLLGLVKATGSGPALKRAIIAVLGGGPVVPAKAPEPLIVEKIVEVPVEKVVEKVVEKIVEVEVDRPMPSSYVAWKKVDVAKLWSEVPVKTELVTAEGETAVKERVRDDSYQIEMKVSVTLPKPNASSAELAAINPELPKMLREFDDLVASAEVSPFFHYLYELKTERMQQNVTRIDELLSRHNFYDLETALQIKHAGSGRKLLFLQGEMDVVSDGSDGDRWPELDDYISMSQHYQPFTSYGWAKRGKVPNPLLSRWESQLAEYEKEFAISGLSIERNRFLREQIDLYKLQVGDLRARSYLIAEADPFIVIPLSFLGRGDENEFGPAIGDYAVVIYGDKLYPAIAGDAGPSWKFGEASLRMARELSEKASAYNRPVSDLTVTYLVFPGSAEPVKGPPDLVAWHQKCSSLLEEIVGLGEGYSLHEWEDLIAKKKAEETPAETTENAEEGKTTEAVPEPDDPETPAPGPVEPAAPSTESSPLE